MTDLLEQLAKADPERFIDHRNLGMTDGFTIVTEATGAMPYIERHRDPHVFWALFEGIHGRGLTVRLSDDRFDDAPFEIDLAIVEGSHEEAWMETLGSRPLPEVYSLPEFLGALAGAYIQMCEEYEEP